MNEVVIFRRTLSDGTFSIVAPPPPPVGERILFASDRDGQYEIYVMNADGTSVERLTNHTAMDRLPMASPDGQKILFISDRSGNDDVYMMNADGTNVVQLTTDGGAEWGAAWSPNNQWIVFQSNRSGVNQIYLMDASGQPEDNVRLLSGGAGGPAQSFEPRWWPDSSKVLCAASGGLIGTWNVTSGLWTQLLTNGAGPNVSPDGQTVGFGRAANLYLAAANGSNEHLVGSDCSGVPSFSPDSSRVAAIGKWGQSATELKIYNVGNGQQVATQALTGRDTHLHWHQPTQASPPAVTAPTDVSASDGSSAVAVIVAWDVVSGATTYEVWRDTDDDLAGAVLVGETTSTSFQDADAGPGVVYHYWVKAKNSLNTSQPVGPDQGHRALAVPSSVAATDGSRTDKVIITWGAVDGATGYEVWRDTDDAIAGAVKQDPEPSDPRFDDATAAPGTTYHY